MNKALIDSTWIDIIPYLKIALIIPYMKIIFLNMSKVVFSIPDINSDINSDKLQILDGQILF